MLQLWRRRSCTAKLVFFPTATPGFWPLQHATCAADHSPPRGAEIPRSFNSFAIEPMQLDLALEKRVVYDFRIESSALNPVRRGYAVISGRFPFSDVKQTPKKDW